MFGVETRPRETNVLILYTVRLLCFYFYLKTGAERGEKIFDLVCFSIDRCIPWRVSELRTVKRLKKDTERHFYSTVASCLILRNVWMQHFDMHSTNCSSNKCSRFTSRLLTRLHLEQNNNEKLRKKLAELVLSTKIKRQISNNLHRVLVKSLN